jgi:preprotein translocase subunit YajC
MKFGTAFPMSEWLIPFVAQAAQEAAEGAPAPTPTGSLLEFLASPLNLILISAILFMFIVARPQQKQRKEQEQALSGLKKNDRVVTNSGIHGIVVQTQSEDGTVTIRIDENTGARMTVNRDTIANITPSDSKE